MFYDLVLSTLLNIFYCFCFRRLMKSKTRSTMMHMMNRRKWVLVPDSSSSLNSKKLSRSRRSKIYCTKSNETFIIYRKVDFQLTYIFRICLGFSNVRVCSFRFVPWNFIERIYLKGSGKSFKFYAGNSWRFEVECYEVLSKVQINQYQTPKRNKPFALAPDAAFLHPDFTL